MAPISRSSRRRPQRLVPPSKRATHEELSDDELIQDTGPPPKRLKKSAHSTYHPGGPGGGGRWTTNTDRNTGAEDSEDDEYVASRRRSGRDHNVNASTMAAQPPTSSRPRRDRNSTRPRYSSAAAAAAAVAHGDGYKPREERGWEEFHPDLDIDAAFPVFSADEIDGVAPAPPSTNGLDNSVQTNGDNEAANTEGGPVGGEIVATPKRRPGRPVRRGDSLLNGILPLDVPKVIPRPGPNPRERLTLPRPSYRIVDPFAEYEQNGGKQEDYVDRTMAAVGYQESEIFQRPEHRLIRMTEGSAEEDLDLGPSLSTSPNSNAAIGSLGVGRVEYDMDEQDVKWLEELNKGRREMGVEPIKPAHFEVTMTKIEKEWHSLEKRIPKPNPKPPQTQRPRSSSAAAVNGEPAGPGEEQDSKCAICDDGDCENSNAIVFCDGCDLAVHQECYGVPYIPEGQWMCRKCQLIGRGTPTCIFCPNEEGAFKQTTTSKWAHLLCAIWIPEVSLGNPSLMEPVADIEKVPKNRWALQCYICAQKMGACIQCSHKSCYQAFHVSCGRKAQLYLKMKSGHGAPTIMDSNQLKAYCHQHVPTDWAREHGTAAAYAEARSFYHRTMRGRLWADSQKSALALGPSQPAGLPAGDPLQAGPTRITLTLKGDKKKASKVWRLPSGAPVIPEIILRNLEAAMSRFNIRKKKEYVEEAVKYWTLKREARRGAALLKRLQLQMDTFSSVEMTRRNFAGMGAIGKARLDRREEFGDTLLKEMEQLRDILAEVKEREAMKLRDAQMLRDLVDTVYTPLVPLLWPIWEKAAALDTKNVFSEGLVSVKTKLEERYYTSVVDFNRDLTRIFSSDIGVHSADDIDELSKQIEGRASATELSVEQREKRKLAKRILRAIQPALKDALKKDTELSRRPYEQELQDMDRELERSLRSRRNSLADSLADVAIAEKGSLDGALASKANGHGDGAEKTSSGEAGTNGYGEHADDDGTVLVEVEPNTVKMPNGVGAGAKLGPDADADGDIDMTAAELSQAADTSRTPPASTNGLKNDQEHDGSHAVGKRPAADQEPISPPTSYQDDGTQSLGGIPWYLRPFDIQGTTVHDEQWTGREVLRDMSEDLSEIDDAELEGLGGVELDPSQDTGSKSTVQAVTPKESPGAARTRGGKQRKHWKGFK